MCIYHLLNELLQHNLHGTAFEEDLEVSSDPEFRIVCSCRCPLVCPCCTLDLQIALVLSMLAGAIQSAVVTYKAFNITGLGYLWDPISLIVSTCLLVPNEVPGNGTQEKGIYYYSVYPLEQIT